VTQTAKRLEKATVWQVDPKSLRVHSWYDKWIADQGVPIYQGNHVDDLRTLELGPWEARECNAAFLQLDGQKGIVDLRVTEIPPGATLPQTKMLLDEKIYVLAGHGLCNLWADGHPPRAFEWQPHSLFFIPPNYSYQLSNARGDQPARLIHSNRLDIAASIIPNPDVFFNNPIVDLNILYGDDDPFSEAQAKTSAEMGAESWRQLIWSGNFFPDVTAWDKIEPYRQRGAGGHVVMFAARYGGAQGTRATMSIFPGRRYKKAHRHGPGFIIVIPKGEGYTVMWEPGSDQVMYCPWHEGSLVIPPAQWFHQHFNLGAEQARYLKISGHLPATGTPGATIEYAHEEPWIREKFQEELAERGLTSEMPDECYQDPDYQWPYGEDMSGD
jgi:hypothetical protein